MKKYKLIKKYPGSEELGTIILYHEEAIPSYYEPELGRRYFAKDIENQPEFWEACLHTTEDGVGIFHGDTFWFVRRTSTSPTPCKALRGMPAGTKQDGDLDFSTKKKAQEYLDSLKPKFEVGVWYKHHNGTYGLFKNGVLNSGFDSLHGPRDLEWSDAITMLHRETWEKADMKEVKELLLAKAKEDYPIGSKVIGVFGAKISAISNIKFGTTKSKSLNLFSDAYGCLYSNGIWAEIVEEEKYYGVCPYTFEFILGEYTTKNRRDEYNKNIVWFETKEERDEYVKMNKPMFSRQNIIDLLDTRGVDG